MTGMLLLRPGIVFRAPCWMVSEVAELHCRDIRYASLCGGGLAQLVATLVGSTKLLYAGPG